MDACKLYRYLTHSIPEEEKEELAQHCGHCTAKLFLEGKTTPAALNPAPLAEAPAAPGRSANANEPTPKRQRTAADCVAELGQLKELLDGNLLTQAEFLDLKARLLEGK